jgi:hypothetical protein
MAITTEASTLSGPQSAAHPTAIALTAALVRGVTFAAIVASAAIAGNAVKGVGTMSKGVAVLSIISSTAKLSLHAYFEGVNWPLNKGLPRGAEFSSGMLGEIARHYCLGKIQVARKKLNYKKGKYMNT